MLSFHCWKSFVSFKNEFLLFWTRVQFKGGSQVLQNFGGGLLISGGLTDSEFFFFWEGGKEGDR